MHAHTWNRNQDQCASAALKTFFSRFFHSPPPRLFLLYGHSLFILQKLLFITTLIVLYFTTMPFTKILLAHNKNGLCSLEARRLSNSCSFFGLLYCVRNNRRCITVRKKNSHLQIIPPRWTWTYEEERANVRNEKLVHWVRARARAALLRVKLSSYPCASSAKKKCHAIGEAVYAHRKTTKKARVTGVMRDYWWRFGSERAFVWGSRG